MEKTFAKSNHKGFSGDNALNISSERDFSKFSPDGDRGNGQDADMDSNTNKIVVYQKSRITCQIRVDNFNDKDLNGAATTGVVGAVAGADTGVTGTAVGGAKAGAVARVDGSNPVKGDIIVITGATLYAVSNVSEIKKAAFLTVYFVPTALGRGVSEINAYFNGVDTPIMLGSTTLLVKIIGSIGAVSIGLDLGKEEPLIHIGSYIVSLLGQGGSDNVNFAGIRSVTSTMIGTSEISSYMAHH
ncbi:hypothetical protein FXO38_15352 [Capsicum annuum]|nr:hypothetical protein FXO38_15352 [Capsicum annuum]KAF3673283.1 hypothetical protein FXO37_07076 [Capsicum annuum]